MVLVAAGAGLAYWQASSTLDELHAGPKRAVVRAVEPELHRAPKRTLVALPPEPNAQTILLIGSDHRQRGGDGSRSDTVMLVRIQPKRNRIALLSIPRDLYVSIPGHGHDRINMAYHYGGERLLTRVVRDTLGVGIDHFVEVDFHGFKDIVQTLGGVWFPVDRRYYNKNVGTAETNYANIDLRPGYQKLNGAEALAFARYRHDDSDFVRAARQQLLLRVVAQDGLGDKWDLLRLRRLARELAEATTSDISSLGEVLSLARAVHETPSSSVARVTLRANDVVLYGADYVASTPEQLRATVRAWEGLAGAARLHARAASRRRAATPRGEQAPGGNARGAPDRRRYGPRTPRVGAERHPDLRAYGAAARLPVAERRRALLRPGGPSRDRALREQRCRRLRPVDVHDLGRPADPGKTIHDDPSRRPLLRRDHERRPDPHDRLACRSDPRVDHELAARQPHERADAGSRDVLQVTQRSPHTVGRGGRTHGD